MSRLSPKRDERGRQSLRLDGETWDAIDAARGKRPGTVSRNTWITEAILEKLKREQSGSDKKVAGEVDA